jgi:S-adenosylmethionine-dependent methyltransferase
MPARGSLTAQHRIESAAIIGDPRSRCTVEDLVRGYYDKRADEEWQRHDRHRMEFAVSKRLLAEHLSRRGRVLDCGGGPGRYAIWLASQGYELTLFDLSRACLDKARTEAQLQDVSLRCELGTATDLSRFKDASFDAVLLMGPLYHLRQFEERRLALMESARVLRPGGLVAAAFITRVAPLRYVAKEQPETVLELHDAMLNVTRQGFDESFPPPDDDHFNAYFAHPWEIEPLLHEAGLSVTGLFAVEGFVGTLDETMNALEGSKWDAWVDLNYRLASEPTLFSAADHVLAFAKKS